MPILIKNFGRARSISMAWPDLLGPMRHSIAFAPEIWPDLFSGQWARSSHLTSTSQDSANINF